jgi:hypothetical protein
VAAVHVAGALAEEVRPADPAKHVGSGARLDEALVQQLGLATLLPDWRALARDEATATASR